MSDQLPTRDELAQQYFDQLQFDPYPVQEEALLAWFTEAQGVLVCAPTGTGKTLIAEAAIFEALHTGKKAYYTTPLIALTEQKFAEMQRQATEWGFHPNDIGLVTGNRQVNSDAPILIVVAEILLNRLMHAEAFDFADVGAVVMDEFHSFNDLQRGVVWELSLALLPAHVRTLLLSATVGNAIDFASWLRRSHDRNVEVIQGDERKVPLTYHWVGESLLSDHLVEMASGEEENRRTPALVFCFNREQCWNVAEQLKGKALINKERRKELLDAVDRHNWSEGAGPKLKQILQRGIGVHHAGVLPKYRRIVEDLFQRKLLSVAVCTETLSAGINLPARSVVVPELMKGPPDKKKLIEPSSAHQIFGRAGRPQYDTEGHVFALAHEDDVKLSRWRERYDQIPEGVKDPKLIKAKKALKKKMPKRRANVQYWTEGQFEKLQTAPPSKLESKGRLPWRLLAYLLDASPEVEPLREFVARRFLDSKRLDHAQNDLDRMLMILYRAGYVELVPRPPVKEDSEGDDESVAAESPQPEAAAHDKPSLTAQDLTLGGAKIEQPNSLPPTAGVTAKKEKAETPPKPAYRPKWARPTELLPRIMMFRSVNPLYGVYLINQLGIASREERIQAMESVLEVPGSVARLVRVPRQEELPPGPLAITRLDGNLLQLGLATEEELVAQEQDDDNRPGHWEERKWVLTLAEKLRLQFDHDFPGVHDLRITPVWAAGAVLEFGGDFNKFVTSHRLQKQEGVIFRHLLRMILLIGEFIQITPADCNADEWQGELNEISEMLTASCRDIDPSSTEQVLEQMQLAAEMAKTGEAML